MCTIRCFVALALFAVLIFDIVTMDPCDDPGNDNCVDIGEICEGGKICRSGSCVIGRVYRRPLVFIAILLLSLFYKEVKSSFCPDSCQCMFNNITIPNNKAICHFVNSSVNVTWGYKYHMPASFISCEGKSYTCADMPQFDIKTLAVSIYITSCSSTVLECLDYMYPSCKIITNLTLHDMIDLHTLKDFKIEKRVFRLELSSKDATTDIPIGILNKFSKINNIDIIRGNVKINPNLTISNTRKEGLMLGLYDNDIRDLPDDTFNGIYLDCLDIVNASIEHITASALRGLDTLVALDLNGNKKLKSINPKAFSTHKNLHYLYLENNALESLPSGIFSGLDNLRQVNIKNNLKALNLGSKLFANLRLFSLIMTNSKISVLPEDIFEELLDVVHINLARNMIKALPTKLFETTTALQEIILRSNRILKIPDGIFSKLYYLQLVDLRHNHIIEFSRHILAFHTHLLQVWLDGNRIRQLDLDMFNKSNITKFSARSNQISSIVANSSLSLYINDMNLSGNNIAVLEDWLITLKGTWKLNLSRNKINVIKESYLYAPHKTQTMKIDLRHNNISYITREKSLSKDSSPSLTKHSVYLAHNFLKCDCPITTLLKKMNTDHNLLDYENIVCENFKKNLSDVTLYSLCNQEHNLIHIVVISIFGSLIIFIIIITIVIRRNEIWQFIINVFSGNSDLRHQKERLDARKAFDLFISFAHQDDEFVGNILLPKLEKEYNQTVCVHYRDWLVGDLIPDQIIKSVESSRKTILILTKHFLLSEWSHLEFHTAHSFSKQEGTSKLIIIVPDESILMEELTADLKSYIVINDYLLWGDSEFWEKLKMILPRQGKKLKKRQIN